jgi:guanine deaminase
MARPADAAPRAYRGPLLRFLRDPGTGEDPAAWEYFPDGLLYVVDGKVAAAGPAGQVQGRIPPSTPVAAHAGALLVAGFIDTHIHYPQLDVIAAGGRALLDWLRDYTFPEEQRFADSAHAATVSDLFLDELLANGTTTANVFCTVHAGSVDAFFEAAERRGLRMIAGKVLMDRNAPEALLDDAVTGIAESRRLLQRWHGHDRLLYAITPRFAATSTMAQLAGAGALAAEFPSVYVHTHLAENHDEIAWVRELFPESDGYLDVYARTGLLRPRAIYAHCIHLDAAERRRFAASGAAAAFCPTSNLYLGSGLFDLDASDAAGMHYSIATDVGGGTSFSPLRTLGDAHKVAQLRGQHLPPLRAFYLASRGAARCLDLEDCIGTLAEGSEADFVILDMDSTPLMARRNAACRTLSDQLRVLMTLGDERGIGATFSGGRPLHLAGSYLRSHTA